MKAMTEVTEEGKKVARMGGNKYWAVFRQVLFSLCGAWCFSPHPFYSFLVISRGRGFNEVSNEVRICQPMPHECRMSLSGSHGARAPETSWAQRSMCCAISPFFLGGKSPAGVRG